MNLTPFLQNRLQNLQTLQDIQNQLDQTGPSTVTNQTTASSTGHNQIPPSMVTTGNQTQSATGYPANQTPPSAGFAANNSGSYLTNAGYQRSSAFQPVNTASQYQNPASYTPWMPVGPTVPSWPSPWYHYPGFYHSPAAQADQSAPLELTTRDRQDSPSNRPSCSEVRNPQQSGSPYGSTGSSAHTSPCSLNAAPCSTGSSPSNSTSSEGSSPPCRQSGSVPFSTNPQLHTQEKTTVHAPSAFSALNLPDPEYPIPPITPLVVQHQDVPFYEHYFPSYSIL